MARLMGESGQAFRTRIEYRTFRGTTTIFEGPYASVGPAKTRVIWAERIYKDRLVNAVVERTATRWEPVTE